MENSLFYAIDFGTSNSLLAAIDRGKNLGPLEVDSFSKDKTILRSLMYFGKSGAPLFGQSAIEKYVEEAAEGRLIRSIKKYLPSPQFTGTRINNKHYNIEDLVSRFLRELKERADFALEANVEKVVLGRPAKFSLDIEKDQLAQSRLQKAAELAGFKEIHFCPEPLAAAYEYQSQLTEKKLVLVVDLGGGTSDFTVIRMSPKEKLEVLSMGGISVAGDALDGVVMSEQIAPYFGSEVMYQMPLSSNRLKMPANLKYRLASPADITLMSRSDIMSFLKQVQQSTIKDKDNQKMENLFQLISENQGFAIFEEIEKGKREVCEKHYYDYCFENLGFGFHHNIDYQSFVQVTQSKIDEIFKCLDEVLIQSGVKANQINAICLTGGTAQVPIVKGMLAERFGIEKVQAFKNFHSVIRGLAERAIEISRSC